MAWAIFAVLMIIYKVTGRKSPGKGGGKGDKFDLVVSFVRETLLVAAICSLVFAPLPFGLGTVGTAVGNLMLWVFGLVGGLFGASGTLIATVLLVGAVVVAIWDVLSDRKIDRPAKNALIAIPFLTLIAAGPVASGASSVVSNVHETGTASVSSVLGG